MSAATSCIVAPRPIAPKQSASKALRGTVGGSSVARRCRMCRRASSGREATLEHKSSLSATRIFVDTASRSASSVCRWFCSSPTASQPATAARLNALAAYLERAPVRKAAWLAESFVRSASTSASWLRNWRAPCSARTATRCFATRARGPAPSREKPPEPPPARCCSARRASRAEAQELSCCKAGRTLSAPRATRRNRTPSMRS
mmetsp:Transcript_45952/g.131176  ORF Transcript_45952/g.131176 Transcript_45952/m.131176 type:complete len:204 (-) Transcript_45952:1687-2298(-)